MKSFSLLSLLLLVSCLPSSVHGTFGDFFDSLGDIFGNGGDDSNANSNSNNNDREFQLQRYALQFWNYYRSDTVNIESSTAGNVGEAYPVSKLEARAEGQKALNCLVGLSGLNMNKVNRDIPLWTWLRNIAYETTFTAFESTNQIGYICDVQQRRANFASLQQQHNRKKDRHLRERRDLGTPAKIENPAELGTDYGNWVESRLAQYTNGDTSNRCDPDVLTREIHEPSHKLSATVARLEQSRGGMDIACTVFGIIELGFDPGDFCRIISNSIGYVSSMAMSARAALQRDLEMCIAHDQIINGVQIQAINTNTDTLVTNLL